MLTPPYHFSIVACPPILQDESDNEAREEILYRGAIPSVRNFPFLKRLKLKTIICLQKKAIDEGEALSRWSKKHKVEIVWQKVEKMTEESLGMTRNQVSDIIKTILDPSVYPLYIADKDGISHTTLLVSCLRKLQGWTSDSILDEIIRFEPDHEDMPLVPFITSYLASGPSSETLTLPNPPFPSWLWPTTIHGSTGISDKPTGGISHSRSNTSLSSKEGKDRDLTKMERENQKEKDKSERDRSVSAPAIPGTLPFPNPLTVRKHPTMKLSFPIVPISTSMLPPPIPIPNTKTSTDPSTTVSPSSTSSLSRVSSRREPRSRMVSSTQEEDQSLMAAATSILSATLVTLGVDSAKSKLGKGETKSSAEAILNGPHGATRPVTIQSSGSSGLRIETAKGGEPQAVPRQRRGSIAIASEMIKSVATRLSPSQLLSGTPRQEVSMEGRAGGDQASGDAVGGQENEEAITSSPDAEEDEEDIEDEMEIEETETEDDEDDDEDEDDDDDDDDDRGLPPTSLHISALDLAGYG